MNKCIVRGCNKDAVNGEMLCKNHIIVLERSKKVKTKSHKDTLCWYCKNSVPDKSGKVGCNWSRFLLPLPGWDAEKVTINNMYNHRKCVRKSYIVKGCPEFVRG